MTFENQKLIEQKWQKKWKSMGAWDTSSNNSNNISNNNSNNKEKFFINFAYPYANSVMHIGHGRTITITDVVARYQRLRGKNVLFPLGYHISGTPVLAVADGIKRGDEKTIKQVKDAISDYIVDEKEQEKLIQTFHDPQNIANFFSQTIEEALDSVGMSITYKRQFTTGEPIYNSFIKWQYEKLRENGLLKQGKYPILYSAQDENAVGEDDIKDGDIDKVGISEMSYIMAKLENSNEYLVAGTLRPDALFGITNMYVKSDMNLVKLNINDKIWIVSKASQVKIEHQFDNVEFISEHSGSEFIGENVIAPITNKVVPILEGSFCDENHATGIVFSSPADSVHDYLHLFEHTYPNKSLEEFQNREPLNLTPITKTFDKKGQEIKYKNDIPAYSKLLEHKVYSTKGNEEKLEEMKKDLYKESHFGAIMINCGEEFDGTPLKNNQGFTKTKQKLEELQLGGTLYETTRRAQTRGGDTVIVANLSGQWFLDYSSQEVKQKALSLMEYMTYKPQNLKLTQIGYINWANMRPCARKRGLGTKLPYDENWIIEPLSDSTIYQMLYIIMHVLKEHSIEFEKLTPQFYDYVYLGVGNVDKISKHTTISTQIINECREEVLYWNNVDFRYTAWGHMSNHLNFLIYHYSIIFPQSMWPKQICVGQFMMRNGEKISKSKGNGTPLFRIKDIYGADLYRLYLIVSSNFDVEMDFKDDEDEQVEKKFKRIKEIIEETILQQETPTYEPLNSTQKWLIAKFYIRVQEAFEFFEEIKLREAYVKILFEFMQEITYSIRRIGEIDTYKALSFVIEDLIKILTPIIPHTCEEMWEKLGRTTLVSHESINTQMFEKYISKEIIGEEEIIEQLVSDIGTLQDQKKGIKLTLIVAPKQRFELFDSITKLRFNNTQIKEMMVELQEVFKEDSKFISKFVPKTFKSGVHYYLTQEKEINLLESIIPFLKEEFNFENIKVLKQEISQVQISNSNIPSKPQIIIE
ncbi:MAG: leucine--tRNA ligase [Nanoarchaeota archaeon]|nr:leucine--tRNA ligase [Nanoarchaeota archaeon]